MPGPKDPVIPLGRIEGDAGVLKGTRLDTGLPAGTSISVEKVMTTETGTLLNVIRDPFGLVRQIQSIPSIRGD